MERNPTVLILVRPFISTAEVATIAWSLGIESSTSPRPAIPYLLHFFSKLAFRLALFDSQLFEVHICCIERGGGVPSTGSLLAQEVTQCFRDNLLAVLEGLADLPTKTSLGDVWLAKIGIDFLADLVASLVDLDLSRLLPIQMYV